MNDDLISRQAAMDEMSKQQTYKMFVGEDTVYLDANDVGSVLASLPSAQSDVHDRNVGEWDMFDLITSAYYGKTMYSKYSKLDNGIVYSRYSCKYMSMDEAIREFLAVIGEDIG